MIKGLVYDQMKAELNMVLQGVKYAIAVASDDDSSVAACMTPEELDQYMSCTDTGDFSCLDIRGDNSLRAAEAVRKKFPQAALLLIVDQSVSPMKYIKPSIMASSLILRPFTEITMKETLQEFVGSCIKEEDGDEEVYVLEGKSGIIRIPYKSIYYVEANMKKVFIRLKNEEYSFFSTLEKLNEELPDNFARCHRGFLINCDRVIEYRVAENEIILDDDTRIPVSRSYKNTIRTMLSERNS